MEEFLIDTHQVSKVNGYTVASLENHAAVASVSVYINAGSRFESYEQQGVTHVLRNAAFYVSLITCFEGVYCTLVSDFRGMMSFPH